eukprot:5511027-Prymnesium_polylepis.2
MPVRLVHDSAVEQEIGGRVLVAVANEERLQCGGAREAQLLQPPDRSRVLWARHLRLGSCRLRLHRTQRTNVRAGGWRRDLSGRARRASALFWRADRLGNHLARRTALPHCSLPRRAIRWPASASSAALRGGAVLRVGAASRVGARVPRRVCARSLCVYCVRPHLELWVADDVREQPTHLLRALVDAGELRHREQ